MVRLGLIRSPEQAPRRCHRVCFRPCRVGEAGRRPELFGNARAGHGSWELRLPLGASELDASEWAPILVGILADLGWEHWWLDSKSLSTILGRSPGFVLKAWGRSFWPLYKRSGVIYFLTGWHRRNVLECVRGWENTFPHLAFSPEHDLESRTDAPQGQATDRGLGDMWRRVRELLNRSS